MKSKRGYVVLQISIFLGLLAFIGLMILEIERDKKKFIDVSTNEVEIIEEIEVKIGKAILSFKNEILKLNITEEELVKKYTSKGYQQFDINIRYDDKKSMFVAKSIKDDRKLCIVYYDYEVKKNRNDAIIKTIEFYEV